MRYSPFVGLVLCASLAAQQSPAPLVGDSLNNLAFRHLGPSVAGGRVTAVVGVPGEPGLYYVGAAAGGVWKTVDAGNSWTAVFRDQPTASIGAVALAPSNPNLVWVGTGEANLRNDIINGHGVFMSPDAGRSWRFSGLPDAGQIARIVVDPQNPDIVFVAAIGHAWTPNPDRGVFRTADGGRTWQKVLFVNDTTGCADLVMDPGNPTVLFAAMWQVQRHPWQLVSGGPGSGIYRSTDGGLTWTRLTEGLPDGPFGRMALGIGASNPTHVYALIEAKKGLLWESYDLGDHWKTVSDYHGLDVRPFYFSLITVSPEDDRHVFFSSFELRESVDGGKTSHLADRGVHVDHHALWIDPKDPRRIVQGDDGGVYLTADGGKSWAYLNNLPIEQFYMVAADANDPYTLCGGLQDNNAWCGPATDVGGEGQHGAEWYPVVGGDGEYAVPAPSDSSILYADSQNGHAVRLDPAHRHPPLYPALHERCRRRSRCRPHLSLQLDVPDRRVGDERRRGVAGRERGLQIHGRRSPLDGDQPRPHPQRPRAAGDERRADRVRHLRRGDLQHDPYREPSPPRTRTCCGSGPTMATSKSPATVAGRGRTSPRGSSGCPAARAAA